MSRNNHKTVFYVVAAVAWAGYVGSIVQIGLVVVDGVQRDRSRSVTRVLYYKDDKTTFEPIGQVYRGNRGTVLAAIEELIPEFTPGEIVRELASESGPAARRAHS